MGILLANNPSVPGFDPKLLMTWLLLVDCNNQYGWAMSQYLPVGGFEWEEDMSRLSEDMIKNLKHEQDEGFILEVDLEYPQELHDKHDQILLLLYLLLFHFSFLAPISTKTHHHQRGYA